MKKPTSKPPATLSPAARTWWQRLTDEYAIVDSGGLLLLQTALEAYDRMSEARALIEKHGVVVIDPNGALRSNPACAIERDSRASMMSALKSLQFDMEPLRSGPGKPPGAFR